MGLRTRFKIPLVTLGKVQKILLYFRMSENSVQSFIMDIYENYFLTFQVSADGREKQASPTWIEQHTVQG